MSRPTPGHPLMEDAATAEIPSSQVWQLIADQVELADTGESVLTLPAPELVK